MHQAFWLYFCDPDHILHRVQSGLAVKNGLAASRKGCIRNFDLDARRIWEGAVEKTWGISRQSRDRHVLFFTDRKKMEGLHERK